MLFDSTLRHDLRRSFGATLTVILTIVLTMFLIRTLGDAAVGRSAPEDVVMLLALTSLGHFPTMLALSLFIATVSTLSRMYRDSEMAIWFASGVGLGRFVRPCLEAIWPVLLLVALSALLVWPWVNQKSEDLKLKFEQRSDLSRVAPGKFQSSRDGSRVFFIEKSSEDAGIGRNVFVMTRETDRDAIITAQSGRVVQKDGRQYVELVSGQRHEQNDAGASTIARFDTYEVLVGEARRMVNPETRPRAVSTFTLFTQRKANHDGELAWRFGLVFGAFNMLLLGVGLSATNPRRASNWNLMTALLGFVIYYNLISLTQSWVSAGKWELLPALISVHGGALILAMSMIWWRDHAITILSRFSRTRGSKP